MKKLISVFAICLLLCGMMFGFIFQRSSVVYAEDLTCQVVAESCYIYKDRNFEEKVTDSDGKTVVLKHGQVLNVLESEQEDSNYIYIETNDEFKHQGYVYKYYVTFNKNQETIYPVFNAKVVVSEAKVYDLQQNATELRLSKDTELYLYQGYKRKADFTAVCFVQENGQLYYGFLMTDDLAPYGVNAGLITGIMVVASCVTIILLLLFMKKVKKIKKKKVNSEI